MGESGSGLEICRQNEFVFTNLKTNKSETVPYTWGGKVSKDSLAIQSN